MSALDDEIEAVGTVGTVETVQTVKVPVLASETPDTTPAPWALYRRRSHELIRAVAPTGQAVAVATGGFIAGAAVMGLTAHRRARGSRTSGRSARRRGRRTRGAGELVRIVGTRSLLVDVHLLDGR